MRKTAIVTGGGGEIGSAISKLLSENEYDVIITYHSNKIKAEKALSQLQKGNHAILQAPNTDSHKIAELFDFVKNNYGSLDLLVNNAGITTPVNHADLNGLSDEWIDKIMQTNFRGSFAMIRAFEPLLQKSQKQSALILNISSIAGIYGIGSNVAYCASKAAMDSMTRSLARVLAPKIRVISVAPGFVDGEYAKSFDPAFLTDQLEKTPLERFALGNDIANSVLSAAEHLTFSTGNIITVDGGRLLK